MTSPKKVVPQKKQNGQVEVTPEARFRMIQEEAYMLAEKDGFAGDAISYWLAAEREVDTQLQE